MLTLKQTTCTHDLMHWRKEVIENVFRLTADDKLMAANEAYYLKHIADGTHIALMAELDGVACGCGAICLTDELPSPDNPTGRCAYLMNIYVREPFRHKGIGHRIVEYLISMAKKLNCRKIYLETTNAGKPLYVSLGFHDMHNMMKYDDTDH